MSRRIVSKVMAVAVLSTASLLVYVSSGGATAHDGSPRHEAENVFASTGSNGVMPGHSGYLTDEVVAAKEQGTTRTPEEVWQHHLAALDAGDLDEIVADYADDSVLITSNNIWRGKDGVRTAYAQSGEQFKNVVFDRPTQIFAGNVLFVEFTGSSAETTVLAGAETFVFRDGLIQTQTLRYTLQHRKNVPRNSGHVSQ
jgi:hypothetical protein